MDMAAMLIAGLVFGFCIYLLMALPIWWLYCAVMPALLPNLAHSFTDPNFFTFAGAWFLLGLVGSVLFGSSRQ